MIAEVRAIRAAHQKRARRIGRKKYIEELNEKHGCFLGRSMNCADTKPAEALQVKDAFKQKCGE